MTDDELRARLDEIIATAEAHPEMGEPDKQMPVVTVAEIREIRKRL